MPNEGDILSVSAEIDLSQWTKNFESLASDADTLDNLHDVDISVSVDTSDVDSELANIKPEDIDVGVSADTSQIDAEISEVDPGVIDVPTTADTDALSAEIDAVTPEAIDVPTTADTDALDAEIAAVTPEAIDVSVTESDDSKAVVDGLNKLTTINALQIAISVVGNALDFVKSIEDITIQPIVDLDNAMTQFGTQTGATQDQVKAAGDVIKNAFYGNEGSIDNITKVAIAAQTAGAPLADATNGALQLNKAFSQADPTQAFQAANQLVKNGLVPNFQAAYDLLTKGFQSGANQGGTFLTSIQNNSAALKGLGLDGQQSLNLITSGLSGGFNTAQDVITAVDTLKKNVTAAATNPNSSVNGFLNQLGLDNPIAKGQEFGADFLNSVITALKNAPPGSLDEITQGLFGKQGVKNTSAFTGLSIDEGADSKGALSGAFANEQSSIDELGNQVKLALQGAVQDFLSSDQIDLPGKLKAIKDGLTDAVSVLKNGGTLNDAIAVTLHQIGIDTSFEHLEAGLDQFIITILQFVASVQDLTGHGDQATATRNSISDVAGSKLTLDLEAGGSVKDALVGALNAGIKPETLVSSVQNAVKGELVQGNIAQAQAIADEFKGANFNGQSWGDQLQNLIKDAQAKIDAHTPAANPGTNPNGSNLGFIGNFAGSPNNGVADASRDVDAVATSTQTLGKNAQDTVTPLDQANAGLAQLGDNLPPAGNSLGTFNGSVTDTGTSSNDAVSGMTLLGGSIDDVKKSTSPTITIMGNLSGIQADAAQTATQYATALDTLSTALANGLAKASGAGGSGGVSGNSAGSGVTVNNTFNTQSPAQSNTAAQQVGNAVKNGGG